MVDTLHTCASVGPFLKYFLDANRLFLEHVSKIREIKGSMLDPFGARFGLDEHAFCC